jgi:YggT family protein
MGAVLGLVSFLLLVLQMVLLARAVLDWSVTLAGPSAPGSIRSRVTGAIYAVTEPILAPVRRVIPPLRLGGFAFDTAFLVVFLALIVLRALLP